MPCRFDIGRRSSLFGNSKTDDLAMIGFVYAVAAGFCAAIASTCAKLAMSPDLQTTFWCDFVLQNVLDGPTLTSVCQTVSSVLSFMNGFSVPLAQARCRVHAYNFFDFP